MYRVQLEFIMDDDQLAYFYEWIQKKPNSNDQVPCLKQTVNYEV